MTVIGVDPGLTGAIVVTDGKRLFEHYSMPLEAQGKNKSVHFDGLHAILHDIILAKHGPLHVYLERAKPFGQGALAAFNYGRGFETVTIAIRLLEFPVTLVDPHNWAKEMHEGIASDLKPKAKSLIAAQRLFPQLVGRMPKSKTGKLLDGCIDALLIAGYGLRKSHAKPDEAPDFF